MHLLFDLGLARRQLLFVFCLGLVAQAASPGRGAVVLRAWGRMTSTSPSSCILGIAPRHVMLIFVISQMNIERLVFVVSLCGSFLCES